MNNCGSCVLFHYAFIVYYFIMHSYLSDQNWVVRRTFPKTTEDFTLGATLKPFDLKMLNKSDLALGLHCCSVTYLITPMAVYVTIVQKDSLQEG